MLNNSVGPCGAGEADNQTTAMVLYSDTSESVEWINMCWRKVRGTSTTVWLVTPHAPACSLPVLGPL